MAAQTLPVSALHFSTALDREIAALDSLVTRTFAQVHLGECDYSSEFCDCADKATVHHLASEREFCLRHFMEVTRG